jgi:hypothetical protein
LLENFKVQLTLPLALLLRKLIRVFKARHPAFSLPVSRAQRLRYLWFAVEHAATLVMARCTSERAGLVRPREGHDARPMKVAGLALMKVLPIAKLLRGPRSREIGILFVDRALVGAHQCIWIR